MGAAGQTPLLRHWTERDKVSAISALSVSPQRRRVGLYHQLFLHNIRQQDVGTFLRHLLRHLRGPVIVVLDNAQIHRGRQLRHWCARRPRLHLEYFPGYAPELNPDEGVWACAKRALANGQPDNVHALRTHLGSVLDTLRGSRARLRACITHSRLPLFLR